MLIQLTLMLFENATAKQRRMVRNSAAESWPTEQPTAARLELAKRYRCPVPNVLLKLGRSSCGRGFIGWLLRWWRSGGGTTPAAAAVAVQRCDESIFPAVQLNNFTVNVPFHTPETKRPPSSERRCGDLPRGSFP